MKKVNWLDHLVNLVVVILGISIAFYLESSKENRQNNQLEKQYLESLSKDLEADLKTLDTLVILNKKISQAAIGLVEATKNGYQKSNQSLVQDVLLLQYNPYFTPQATVYSSLKSSGQIDLIRDFEMRGQIVDLYEQYYRGVTDYNMILSEHVRDFLKPYFIENMKFESANTLNPDFLRDSEFQNMVFIYRQIFVSKESYYQTVHQKTEALHLSIKSYLESL